MKYRDFLCRAEREWNLRETEHADSDDTEELYWHELLAQEVQDPDQGGDEEEEEIERRLARQDQRHFGKYEIERLSDILQRRMTEELEARRQITLPGEELVDRSAGLLLLCRLGTSPEVRKRFQSELKGRIEKHLARAHEAENGARRFSPTVMPRSTDRFGSADMPTQGDPRRRS